MNEKTLLRWNDLQGILWSEKNLGMEQLVKHAIIWVKNKERKYVCGYECAPSTLVILRKNTQNNW